MFVAVLDDFDLYLKFISVDMSVYILMMYLNLNCLLDFSFVDYVGAIGSRVMMTLTLTMAWTLTLGVDVDVDVGVWLKLC